MTNKELHTLYLELGSARAVARKTGIPRSTVRDRLDAAMSAAQVETVPAVERRKDQKEIRDARIDALNKSIRHLESRLLTEDFVRSEIFKLASIKEDPPKWTYEPTKHKHTGIPLLHFSDWHVGETVLKSQTMGMNEFNLDIMHRRAKDCVRITCDLLLGGFVGADYPGIVLAINGDIVSGDIHEELLATNDQSIMPCVIEAYNALVAGIEVLKKEFKKVFVVVTPGNHGRVTKKPWNKNFAFTNYDWLIGMMLKSYFQRDENISFHIPDGGIARYRLYGHGYRQQHGHTFKGGDGWAGPLMPVSRGDMKARAQAISIGDMYETMIVGHFHRFIPSQQAMMNGTMKGWDEFAINRGYPFEPPSQSLWITHKSEGITYIMAVRPDGVPNMSQQDKWLAVLDG